MLNVRFYFFVLCIVMSNLCDAFVLGISGGSGSGKSTIMHAIKNRFPGNVTMLSQDSYYKDLSHLSLKERSKSNFDHPNSIDFEKFREDIISLVNGESIQIPIYDFKTHTRVGLKNLTSSSIIVVEGILLLAISEIRELFDYKVFVEVDNDLRLLRRASRDLKERGRDFKSVKKQYLTTVYPMYLSFVEPSKRFADMIIPWNEYNESALTLLFNRIQKSNLELR
jgi:uridine kinase